MWSEEQAARSPSRNGVHTGFKDKQAGPEESAQTLMFLVDEYTLHPTEPSEVCRVEQQRRARRRRERRWGRHFLAPPQYTMQCRVIVQNLRWLWPERCVFLTLTHTNARSKWDQWNGQDQQFFSPSCRLYTPWRRFHCPASRWAESPRASAGQSSRPCLSCAWHQTPPEGKQLITGVNNVIICRHTDAMTQQVLQVVWGSGFIYLFQSETFIYLLYFSSWSWSAPETRHVKPTHFSYYRFKSRLFRNLQVCLRSWINKHLSVLLTFG